MSNDDVTLRVGTNTPSTNDFHAKAPKISSDSENYLVKNVTNPQPSNRDNTMSKANNVATGSLLNQLPTPTTKSVSRKISIGSNNSTNLKTHQFATQKNTPTAVTITPELENKIKKDPKGALKIMLGKAEENLVNKLNNQNIDKKVKKEREKDLKEAMKNFQKSIKDDKIAAATTRVLINLLNNKNGITLNDRLNILENSAKTLANPNPSFIQEQAISNIRNEFSNSKDIKKLLDYKPLGILGPSLKKYAAIGIRELIIPQLQDEKIAGTTVSTKDLYDQVKKPMKDLFIAILPTLIEEADLSKVNSNLLSAFAESSKKNPIKDEIFVYLLGASANLIDALNEQSKTIFDGL